MIQSHLLTIAMLVFALLFIGIALTVLEFQQHILKKQKKAKQK